MAKSEDLTIDVFVERFGDFEYGTLNHDLVEAINNVIASHCGNQIDRIEPDSIKSLSLKMSVGSRTAIKISKITKSEK